MMDGLLGQPLSPPVPISHFIIMGETLKSKGYFEHLPKNYVTARQPESEELACMGFLP